MTRYIKKSIKTAGQAPGALIHVGEKKLEKTKITVIDYDEKNFQEITVDKIEECYPFKNKPSVTWINIDGIYETEIIEKIGQKFDIHPLVLEDIANTGQRPKTEDFEKYIYIVLKMLHQPNEETLSEQVSIILCKNYVISFQEDIGDVFNSLRDRIRNDKGRIRKMGTDYLAYSLIDAIVDHYFVILEKIGEKIEDVEEKVVDNPNPAVLQNIHDLKSEMIYLRKSVWPLREVISGIQRGGSTLIHKSTEIFLKDVYDHTIQVMDTIETYREMVTGMIDIYMSSISNKMNEVMKVLTIFAAIFIPLTFVAGIYGMNFQNMPELSWEWGYFAILFIMFLIGLILIIYFKRKKWL